MAGHHLNIFVPSLKGGGAERVSAILAAGFASAGNRVDILLADCSGPFLDTLPAEVRIVDFKRKGVLACLPQLVRHLRREPPDALLSLMSHANVIALLANRLAGNATRVVVSERTSFSEVRRHFRSLRDSVVRLAMRLVYPWAAKVIVVARENIEDLHRGIGLPRERIVALPNPVIPKDFEPLSREAVQLAPFAQSRPVIVAAGSLTFIKDFPTLIRAVALARRTCDVALVILGEGPDRTELERLVAELGLAGHVFLPGFVPNPFPYFRAASVFALSSILEGMPGVLIQAMACGTPVVSTDCRSGPREILGDGLWGRLVEVGNPVQLADALVETLGVPPTPGLRLAVERYNFGSAVGSYLEVLLGGLGQTTHQLPTYALAKAPAKCQ
jgi:glycosyltransferase involved in cell wall biosynthesis